MTRPVLPSRSSSRDYEAEETRRRLPHANPQPSPDKRTAERYQQSPRKPDSLDLARGENYLTARARACARDPLSRGDTKPRLGFTVVALSRCTYPTFSCVRGNDFEIVSLSFT